MTRAARTRAAGVVAVLGVAGLLLGHARDDAYTVQAQFVDAGGLRDNAAVKVDGVSVGKVTSLDVRDDDIAVATLMMRRSAGRLGRRPGADIRSANLLGEKYVDVDLGDPTGAKTDEAVIPTASTSAPVELDDLLNVLDNRTRALLGVLINESGIALSGRGADFNKLLRQLPPTLEANERLLGDLSHDNRALGRLVTKSDRVLQSVAQERAPLGRLVGSADGAFASVASRRAELKRTLSEAPSTLTQLRTSLGRLESTAATLGSSGATLHRAAPALTGLLREVPPFSRAATPTLATARRVGPRLERLGIQATPAVGRLRGLTGDLRTFAQAFDPGVKTLDRSFDDLLGFMEGWARSVQVRDGPGHLFRGELSSDQELTQGLIEQYLRPPDASRRDGAGKRRRHRVASRTPAETHRSPNPGPGERVVPDRKLDVLPLKAPPLKAPSLLPSPGGVPPAPKGTKPPAGQDLLDYLLGP